MATMEDSDYLSKCADDSLVDFRLADADDSLTIRVISCTDPAPPAKEGTDSDAMTGPESAVLFWVQ